MLERVRQALAQFLLARLPYGVEIGLVSFASNASVRANLTLLQRFADREQLVRALPTSAYGPTCISCGILAALQVRAALLASSQLR